MASTLLDVKDLTVEFATRRGIVQAVKHVNISLAKGETLGIVGESGSGKTITALSLLRLVQNAQVSGTAVFQSPKGEVELLGMPERLLRGIRGQDIAMIFQEPATSLNPVFTIGSQIAEAIRLHRPEVRRSGIRDEVIRSLKAVQVSDPEQRLDQYPHEMSGGMKQRVMIAMALACNPSLLLLDEPTAGMSPEETLVMMDLIRTLANERTVILVEHKMKLIMGLCKRIIVLHHGEFLAEGTPEEIQNNAEVRRVYLGQG